MDVGTRIREHREAAGLRQDQLAELCQVSRQTVSNWERGKTLPDIVSLKLMADELGTTVDALIGDDLPKIARRADAEARRLLTLFLASLALCAFCTTTNLMSSFGASALMTSEPWWTIRAFALGAWLVVGILYDRLAKRDNLRTYGEIGRYLDKNLQLEESGLTRLAHALLKHAQLVVGVFLDLALLSGLALGGILTPGIAAIVIVVGASGSALGELRDRRRHMSGPDPWNPPLPPQR